MKAAICYGGKFGSTKKYAYWINEQTGFPVYDVKKERPDLHQYDLLILGSSIIVSRPTLRKWLTTNWEVLKEKQLLLYTVSATEPGHPDIYKWLVDSLPEPALKQLYHVPLRGRLVVKELPWYVRMMLKMAAKREQDPEVKKRMREGFDYMDKSSLEPIFEWIAKTLEKTEQKLDAPQLAW